MMSGVRRVRKERSESFKAKQPQEKVVTRDGRVVEISETHVDHLKDRRSLRPVGRNKMGAALHFSMSQSFGKYEQGPDGLWFVWTGGWEPTKLFGGKEVSGHQRDPDGNVWVKQGDDWVLEDEVI